MSFPLLVLMRGFTVPSFEERRALNARRCRPRWCASSATHGKQCCPPGHRYGRHCPYPSASRSGDGARKLNATRSCFTWNQTSTVPLTRSASLSQVHGARALLPFSMSSCAVERPCGAPEAR